MNLLARSIRRRTGYRYDPFGIILESSGPMAETFRFRFSTKYHEPVSGLVLYQKRAYCPELGRWLSRDPIEEEGGLNLYAFCGNNPVDRYDALGLLWDFNVNDLGRRNVVFTQTGIRKGGTHLTKWSVIPTVSGEGKCATISISEASAAAEYWWTDTVAGGNHNLTPRQHELQHVRQLQNEWESLKQLTVGLLPKGKIKREKAFCLGRAISLFRESRLNLAYAIMDGFDVVDGQSLSSRRDEHEQKFRLYHNQAVMELEKCQK